MYYLNMSIFLKNLACFIILSFTFLFAQFNPPQNLTYINTYDFNNGNPINCFFLSWKPPDTTNNTAIFSHYNIYRQMMVDSTWGVADSTNSTGFEECFGFTVPNAYYITAYYHSPEGESEPSNIIYIEPSISIEKNVIGEKYSIGNNYPNPFNPITSFPFYLPKTTFVTISIFNLSGELLETIVNEKMNNGYHVIQWDASNYASGVYFYKIIAGKQLYIGKCILVK